HDGLASSVVSKAGAGGPTLMLNGHVDRDGCGQRAVRSARSEAWRFYNATTWQSLRSTIMAAWRFNGWTTSASWWNRLMMLSPFRRAGPRTRRASHDRRRLVRARHWT